MALCVVAALGGLWLGSAQHEVTESDAIARAAAAYEAATGDTSKPCVAVPGEADGVWIEVRCGFGAEQRRYALDHRGRILQDVFQTDT